ncbi:MAG: SGNH/GDSL hydrolase family protein [Thermoanaerobaculia bacterium]
MKSRSLTIRICLLSLLLVVAALPMFAARGSADFTRYVAIGDSLTSGYESSSLVVGHQIWSFPKIIAQQAGTPDFQQPLISEPGIPAELVLKSISPLIIGPKASGYGAPMNLTLPRPYNNLGIPGARVHDLITLNGSEQNPNPYFQIILRGQASAAAQTIALQPTFITVWIGNNEVLGGVTSGMPAAMTPLENFTADYNTLLQQLTLGAPNAGMITATVPPVSAIPFANVIPPVVLDPTTNQPLLGPDGHPIFYIAQVGDQVVQLGPGSKVLLTAQSFLQQGYGFPAALKPLVPLPHVGEPLPDAVTLTADEIAQIEQRRTDVNAAIKAAASSLDIPVLDSDALFATWQTGIHIAGLTFNTGFITGGLFSLDGVHPTDIGYTIVANDFIRKINEAYGSRIPQATLIPFFQNNAIGLQGGSSTMVPFLAPGALQTMTLQRFSTLDDFSRGVALPKQPVPVRPAPATF